MSKRHHDIENEDPNPVKKAKNDEKSESLSVNEEEEEEENDEKSESSSDNEEDDEPLPIAAVIENNGGTVHPTNKQYFIYNNTRPTMISNTARFWSRKYLKVLRHVNPDAYDV
jgi:hypothetical protein